MSFIRFGPNSDVYMYEHVGGFIVCQECKLGGSKVFDSTTIEGVTFKTFKEAKEHLIKHKEAGHKLDGWNVEDWATPPEFIKTHINNLRLFKLMHLKEVKPDERMASKYESARQYVSEDRMLHVIVAHEVKTSGWYMCVWHQSRYPQWGEMCALKVALIPDDITVAIPLGTPHEMQNEPNFMLHCNELLALNHQKTTN